MIFDWDSRFLWAEDPGTDGGGGGTPDTQGGSSTPAGGEESVKLPSYFSQFKKENREKYSQLSKCKNLDELAELALKGDSYKEPDYTGYVKMPTNESTKEEMRDFLTKMGVPEGPDKYTIPEETDAEPIVKGMEKTLREAAYRSGMTDSQVKNMWGVFRALVDTAKNEGEKIKADRKDNFDERYSKLFDSYTQEAQKNTAIKESLGYFKTFLTETGIGKALEESGALYDEKLVKALADYQMRNRGRYNSGGGTHGKDNSNGSLIRYSEKFYKEFSGK